ncbi:MAG: hypothetical protein ACOX06_01770 [Candidatus Dojkabacteria bacterium]|jgi:hypothetical protein
MIKLPKLTKKQVLLLIILLLVIIIICLEVFLILRNRKKEVAKRTQTPIVTEEQEEEEEVEEEETETEEVIEEKPSTSTPKPPKPTPTPKPEPAYIAERKKVESLWKSNNSFLMYVEDHFNVNGQRHLGGKVLRGSVKKGDILKTTVCRAGSVSSYVNVGRVKKNMQVVEEGKQGDILALQVYHEVPHGLDNYLGITLPKSKGFVSNNLFHDYRSFKAKIYLFTEEEGNKSVESLKYKDMLEITMPHLTKEVVMKGFLSDYTVTRGVTKDVVIYNFSGFFEPGLRFSLVDDSNNTYGIGVMIENGDCTMM